MINMVKRGKKNEIIAFFSPYKTVSLSPSVNEQAPYEDAFLTDLSHFTDDELIFLYQKTKWVSPIYHLRKRYYGKWKELNEDYLFVMVQMMSPKAREEYIKRNKEKDSPNDEALVLMAQDGDEFALEKLFIRYERFIQSIIRRLGNKYFFRGYDKDDLFQEGVIGLFKSKDDYKIERKTRFKDFSKHVIEKHIGTLIYKSSNFKNRTLNESFSYHSPIKGEPDTTFEQFFESDGRSPLENLVNSESHDDIVKRLTGLEKKVLEFYNDGFSYEEVGFKIMQNEEESFLLGNFDLKKIEDDEDKSAHKKLTKMLDNTGFLASFSITSEELDHFQEIMKTKKKAVDNTIQRIRKKGDTYLAQQLVLDEGISLERALKIVKKWREQKRLKG
jgi:RNA polymerase sporulation-specific sigma factor